MKKIKVEFIFIALAILWINGGVAAQPTTPPAQSSAPIMQTDVFEARKGGYFTYRIPSIILTPKGTLIAICEGRKESSSDTGDIDLVMKRSFDQGATWTAMQIIADDGENTVGNPTLVVDRRINTIWLATVRNPGKINEAAIVDGFSRNDRTVWVMKSTDDGATWSPPLEITSSVKKRDWGWYATGPGNGIQLKSGRLVIPSNHSELKTKNSGSHVIYSDNHGATWKLGGIAEAGTNESQVVERADGSLLLNMRNHREHPQMYVRRIATSNNGGLTWSKVTPDPMLLEPICQASIIRHSNGGEQKSNIILFSNPASIKRENLTVRASYDGGRTWTIARQINAKGSAYSNLVSLPDDQIGNLYEYGDQIPYQKIVFARFTLGWLTEKNPESDADLKPVVNSTGKPTN